MALALGLVAVGAAVALLGSGRSTGGTPGVPAAPGSDTGSGAPAALALVALAGAGAALLVRTRARVAVGLVLVVVAVGLVVVGTGPVRWTVLAGGVAVGAGALLVVVRAGRWPQPRRRYDRPASVAGRREDSPREAWDALDRGDDPTT
jgi:hypothetical protein